MLTGARLSRFWVQPPRNAPQAPKRHIPSRDENPCAQEEAAKKKTEEEEAKKAAVCIACGVCESEESVQDDHDENRQRHRRITHARKHATN